MGRHAWRRWAVVATAATVLLAGCADRGPAAPQGSVELDFTEVGTAIESNPDGEWAVATADEAEVQRLLRDPDLRAGLSADDVTVRGGQVAVLVRADYRLDTSEVVRVVETDRGWLVQMRGHEKSECTLPAVVEADVRVLLVDADSPPAEVEQEVHVLPGCGRD